MSVITDNALEICFDHFRIRRMSGGWIVQDYKPRKLLRGAWFEYKQSKPHPLPSDLDEDVFETAELAYEAGMVAYKGEKELWNAQD